ncbi:MAG: hypothetical protein GY952_03815 [Rhodobacteraceae bacterium]|nr:hypothetical protein [Paracoccaceae bacterium]
MKKLNSALVGVDQGSVQLFSDFEDGGEMWTGTGERERVEPVVFSEPFKSAPSVFVTLEMLDVNHKSNHRVETVAQNITEAGFEVSFKTWGDTRVARAVAVWMAIGEVGGDDDWEVD